MRTHLPALTLILFAWFVIFENKAVAETAPQDFVGRYRLLEATEGQCASPILVSMNTCDAEDVVDCIELSFQSLYPSSSRNLAIKVTGLNRQDQSADQPNQLEFRLTNQFVEGVLIHKVDGFRGAKGGNLVHQWRDSFHASLRGNILDVTLEKDDQTDKAKSHTDVCVYIRQQ